jgi:hypothetical protein
MTPGPIDYPTLIAQLPYVSKLATAEQTHPEVRQEIFGPMLLQKQREKEKGVQEVSKPEKPLTVERDGGGGGQPGGHGSQRQHAAPEEEAAEEPAASASPWTGNIIDRKI